MKNCETCGIAIEFDLDNGRTMHFAAHTDDFCKAMARDRIRILELELRRHAAEDRILRYEASDMARKLDAITYTVRRAHDDGNVFAAIEEIARILRPPPAQTAADEIAEREHMARAMADLARIPTVPAVDRGDLFHSQGIDVASILAETPLARPCAVCASVIGQACIEVPNPEYPMINLNGCLCHEARAVTPVIT